MPALKNQKHEKFAQLVASGESKTAAYATAFTSRGRSAEVGGSKLSREPRVALRITEVLAKFAERTEQTIERAAEKVAGEEGRRFLSLLEKRAYLAMVVRTPIGEIDEKSPLCQAVEWGKNGRKIKMPDKLRALELDAKLAGELHESHEVDVVDRRASVIELQERLTAATPLLQARWAKEGK